MMPRAMVRVTHGIRHCHAVALGSGAKYDAVIIGGGHNGLVAAAYLAKAGQKVCLLERRHVLGGAAVTEEIVPGFKFSRASYVLGLLRPKVHQDLDLERHGLKVYPRNPSSYTPMREEYWERGGRSLTLGAQEDQNYQQISQFSVRDAKAWPQLEALLNKFAEAIAPLLDKPPPDVNNFTSGMKGKIKELSSVSPLVRTAAALGKDFPQFYELMMAPATKILDRWLESEPLKATLATDSVIGTMMSPNTPSSGYVLLHHVMAQTCGVKGVWGYPEGGMGGVTQAMARAAIEAGAHLYTSKPVKSILLGESQQAVGVELEEGTCVYANIVLSNATAHTTFLKLLPKGVLPPEFEATIRGIDYTSPVCKINVALKSLPNFRADPSGSSSSGVMPHHRCTIHLNCERTELMDEAYTQARHGHIPDNPMIEVTLPSSCDPTLAPPGCHVALFFTQYVPYTLADGQPWDEQTKTEYAKKIFNIVEEYAPGFCNSVLGYEVLPPPDLERVFGLTGGNIFHGAMSLDQLFVSRPSPLQASPTTPIRGLLLCGSGAHPGGGVMGAAGRLASLTALRV